MKYVIISISESSTDNFIPPPSCEEDHADGCENRNFYNDKLPPFPRPSYYENSINSSSDTDQSFLPRTAVSNYPTKTAERREISKLRRSQKRVMFSDDLENSHTSERSNTLSSHSNSDSCQNSESILKPRKFHRMLSEDITGSSGQLNRGNDWLRRSADSFGRRPKNDKVYDQLPSNQIKFGTGSDFRNRPMGSNIKTYLDKVMEKSKLSSSSDSHVPKSSESDTVFSVDTLMSDSTYRDCDSITTSGTYDLNSVSLASPSYSDDAFMRDYEI